MKSKPDLGEPHLQSARIRRSGVRFADLHAQAHATRRRPGGPVDKAALTQFGRAMAELGIEMIPSYSERRRAETEVGRQIAKRLTPRQSAA